MVPPQPKILIFFCQFLTTAEDKIFIQYPWNTIGTVNKEKQANTFALK